MDLTSSFAMTAAASVSGLYLATPTPLALLRGGGGANFGVARSAARPAVAYYRRSQHADILQVERWPGVKPRVRAAGV